MINWREKFRAFGIHFIATFLVALIAAALIFLVWYPAPFGRMVGGLQLFMLVAGCDLALGPLVSLVIFNSRKTRRALTIDYVLVGIVQIAAFVYGVYSVAQARPAYIAFVKDRYEVIAAGEIADKDLEEAKGAKYGTPSYWGPELVASFVPPKDRSDALWGSLAGRDVSVRPKFFVDYATQLDEIKSRLQPLPELAGRVAGAKPLIDEAIADLNRPAEDFGWLPVKHSKGFWTALVDKKTGYPATYIPLDPY